MVDLARSSPTGRAAMAEVHQLALFPPRLCVRLRLRVGRRARLVVCWPLANERTTLTVCDTTG